MTVKLRNNFYVEPVTIFPNIYTGIACCTAMPEVLFLLGYSLKVCYSFLLYKMTEWYRTAFRLLVLSVGNPSVTSGIPSQMSSYGQPSCYFVDSMINSLINPSSCYVIVVECGRVFVVRDSLYVQSNLSVITNGGWFVHGQVLWHRLKIIPPEILISQGNFLETWLVFQYCWAALQTTLQIRRVRDKNWVHRWG